MLGDLIGRCHVAQDRLDKEADRFEKMRAFEKEAPTVLAGLPAAVDTVEARFPAVEATMTHLAEYADASWQAVATNLDEARARTAAARAAITEGEAATRRRLAQEWRRPPASDRRRSRRREPSSTPSSGSPPSSTRRTTA